MTETAAEPTTISSFVNKELDFLLSSANDNTMDLQRLTDLLKIPRNSRIVSQKEVHKLETLEKKAAAERTYVKEEVKSWRNFDDLLIDMESCVLTTLIFFVSLFAYTRLVGHTPFWIQVVWSGPSAVFGVAMMACYVLVNIPPYPKRQPVTITEPPQSSLTSEGLNNRLTDLLNVFKAINKANNQCNRLLDEAVPQFILVTACHLVYFVIRLIDSVCFSDASTMAIANSILFFALSVITIYVLFVSVRDLKPQFGILLGSLYWKFLAVESKEGVKSKKSIWKKCKKTVKK